MNGLIHVALVEAKQADSERQAGSTRFVEAGARSRWSSRLRSAVRWRSHRSHARPAAGSCEPTLAGRL